MFFVWMMVRNWSRHSRPPSNWECHTSTSVAKPTLGRLIRSLFQLRQSKACNDKKGTNPLLATYLPLATPYDPAEDPPGSVDPLGTVASAEQLADILLPGLTARMWRARHLTFTAFAALVGERAAAAEGSSEEMRLEARLGLERLFVSAIAWKDEKKEDDWSKAARRLPGIGLARRAIRSGHQPLGKQNFLKGQAINGPFGVVHRLARNLDIIDDDNRLSRNGEELLLTWSAEQGLASLLDDVATPKAQEHCGSGG